MKNQLWLPGIIVFSLIIINITVAYLRQSGSNPLPFNAFIILFVLFSTALLIFYRLKIRVDHHGAHVMYGIGMLHIEISPEKG
jgi:4-hydroxybenzoate polyprenyltransferase